MAPDPAASYDQRFYWGVGNPKDLGGSKEYWVSKQKATAGSTLAQSDWYVVRAAEDADCYPLLRSLPTEPLPAPLATSERPRSMTAWMLTSWLH